MPDNGSPQPSSSAPERPGRRVTARTVKTFLQTEAAGGVALMVATLLALALANSPLREEFENIWSTEVALGRGSLGVDLDLRHWVNEALMAIFFFVVGLEVKRELAVGELNSVRKAALPAIAALGGMAVPALFYASLNAGGPGGPGWGIPMATDIAFAVGVLALLGRRAPTSLKVFILSLAVVDDIGAILVIAVFYTTEISFEWLVFAVVLVGSSAALTRLHVSWIPVYALLGAGAWLATLHSGIHATIAGVALGLLTPARPARQPIDADWTQARSSTRDAEPESSVAETLQHVLHPWTSFLVIPLFALANAGVVISGRDVANAASSRVTLGIVLGLVAGKVLGIGGASWVAIRLRLASAPPELRWKHLVGGAAVGGIGFTVSLFITGLAFTDPLPTNEAKIGVLFGSIMAGLLGAAVLLIGDPPSRRAESGDNGARDATPPTRVRPSDNP